MALSVELGVSEARVQTHVGRNTGWASQYPMACPSPSQWDMIMSKEGTQRSEGREWSPWIPAEVWAHPGGRRAGSAGPSLLGALHPWGEEGRGSFSYRASWPHCRPSHLSHVWNPQKVEPQRKWNLKEVERHRRPVGTQAWGEGPSTL